jgi:hypothetical protein
LFQTAKNTLVRLLRYLLTLLDPSDLGRLLELQDQLAKAKNQVSLLESILKKEAGLLGSLQKDFENLEFHRSQDQREISDLKNKLSLALVAQMELEAKLALVLPVPVGAFNERALELAKQFDSEPQGGEWKRHQVYTRLLREFPEIPKSTLATAIELAISRFKS